MNWKFLFLLLFIPFFSNAQGEANNWYFGENAGITFNTSPPSALTNGQLNTNEGCSSISDVNGNLLFYTDGRTVWNRNHQIMSNADYFGGNGLLGDPSSTSSGLIVPHPTNPDLYFIFTVDEPHHDNAATYPQQGPGTADGKYSDSQSGSGVPQDDDGFNNGLNYSVVDMSLNNGLGNIVPLEKNIHLVTYDPNDSQEIKYQCSEKITAVKGSDCTSIWVLTHFINKFYAFKIDSNGVDTTPVISEVGPTIPITAYRRAAIGYMKASPNGKKLIIAHNTKTYNGNGSGLQNGGVYLNDFNDNTGVVSNNITLVEGVYAYGVEFSMETKKVYATAENNGSHKLFQWDLESNDIPNSIAEITSSSGFNQVSNSTALQLGPDGKIYHSSIGDAKLNVINNPELDGNQVNYVTSVIDGAIPLNGREATFGLPPFIQSIFSSRINIINDTEEIVTKLSICGSEDVELEYENIPGASYTWKKNDAVLNNPSPSLTVQAPSLGNSPIIETYSLSVDLNDGSCPLIGTAEITFNPFPTAENTTLTQCAVQSSPNSSIFDLTNANQNITDGDFSNGNIEITYFPSQNEAEQDINSIQNPTNYSNISNPEQLVARVKNTETGCISYSELTISVSESSLQPLTLTSCATDDDSFAIFDLKEAEIILQQTNANFTLAFYLTQNNALTETEAITNITNYENSSPSEQTIYARVENSGSCEGIIPINLKVLLKVPIGEDEIITYCLENLPNSIQLSSGIPEDEKNNYTYLWQPSEKTTETIQTSEIITHTVTVTNVANGCSATRTIEIIPSSKADFTVANDNFLTNNTVQILVSNESEGDYEFSIDNQFSNYQDAPIFDNIPSGTHTIYVKDKNGCGISVKEIVILGLRKFFTPNNDGFNDYWNIIGKESQDISSIKISIYDRFGKLLSSFNGNSRGWDGRYNSKKLPSDDYWYLIERKGKKNIKGNFTLKR